jgi:hypothetical protein
MVCAESKLLGEESGREGKYLRIGFDGTEEHPEYRKASVDQPNCQPEIGDGAEEQPTALN